MMLFLGEEVSASREMPDGDITFVTGRLNGLVKYDDGELKYFTIRGVDQAFWLSDGWKFEDLEIEE